MSDFSSDAVAAIDQTGSMRSGVDLPKRLAGQPWLFEFRQALRILALAARQHGDALQDDLPALVRFRTPVSLAFPPSELTSPDSQPPNDAPLQELFVSFLGLTGPSGVLPTRYTELLIDRKNNYRDAALHDFLDMFSHRAIALFHAANQKYRFYRQLELHNQDGLSRNLLDLVGAGLEGLRGRLALTRESGEADRFLMYYAGILARKPVSATALKLLVEGLLGTAARVRQFQGCFVELAPELQSCLGKRNGALGIDAVIGQRQYDCQTRMTLEIGPLQSKPFAELLPGGSAAKALQELMRFCVGHTLAIDVALVIRHDCVPAPHLSDTAATPKQLGFNTWIRTRPISHDRDDTRYALQL